MTSTQSREMEARWSELEHKYDMRCLWSEVIGNRASQVECMWVPSAKVTIIVIKHYEYPIPRDYSGKKPFPKMTAHYAYFPAGGVTWGEMDKALSELKAMDAPKGEEAKPLLYNGKPFTTDAWGNIIQ